MKKILFLMFLAGSAFGQTATTLGPYGTADTNIKLQTKQATVCVTGDYIWWNAPLYPTPTDDPNPEQVNMSGKDNAGDFVTFIRSASPKPHPRFSKIIACTATNTPATPTDTPTSTPSPTPTPIVHIHSGAGPRLIDADWVISGTSAAVTLPAAKTSKAYEYALGPFSANQTMRGFTLLGKIVSAGNPVTIIGTMSLTTAGATTVIGPPVTITATTNTNLTPTNASLLFSYPQAILATDARTYSLNITGTTGASCSIEIDGFQTNFWAGAFPTPTP